MSHYKYGWNGYIVSNMDIVQKEAIPNKWDALFILLGKEGTGKTTLGTQLAKYFDKDFNLDRCVFTPQQFLEAINTAPPESSILWDEAITGADVDKHGTEVSITIISHLTQIRKKRLKIFICFPYLYKLNKYFVSRCLGSFYVTAKSFDDRGYFKFFSANRTERLYDYVKEKYKYAYGIVMKKAKADVYSRFENVFELPESEYDTKKETSRISADVKTNRHEVSARGRLAKLLIFIKEKKLLSQRDIGELWGCDASEVSHFALRNNPNKVNGVSQIQAKEMIE